MRRSNAPASDLQGHALALKHLDPALGAPVPVHVPVRSLFGRARCS